MSVIILPQALLPGKGEDWQCYHRATVSSGHGERCQPCAGSGSALEHNHRLPAGAADGGEGVQQGAVDALKALLPGGPGAGRRLRRPAPCSAARPTGQALHLTLGGCKDFVQCCTCFRQGPS